MFKKLLLSFLMVVFAAAMSGCAAVGGGIGMAISANMADKFNGVVEVGEVKAKPNANIATLKAAKMSSVVFEKDMVTPNTSPDAKDIKVNYVVAEEAKYYLGVGGNITSHAVIRVKTIYHNSYPGTSWYYLGVTEKNTQGFFGSSGVRKLVNTHLMLEQSGNVILEVHGLWAGGDNSDEIKGARELAREMASEVLKKLSATASTSPAVTEAKKE